MSFVRKVGAEYYVFRQGGHVIGKKCKAPKYDWFSVKTYKSCGAIQLNNCVFPNEFIGKRIRLKVEVIE